MNIIKNDGKYMVYGSNMEVFDSLPIGSYYVRFSKQQGFFLAETPAVQIGEDKVYGETVSKVETVIRKFKKRDRSLGVLLSGDKGTGKSLFTRVLVQRALAEGVPVIMVTDYIPGIASFIESIEQEVLVLFDEFDKTVGGHGDDADARQTEFLMLLDGVVRLKKLYMFVCNNVYRISDFLINRPGRIHYHLRFTTLSEAEIREYMTDRLDDWAVGEIDKVVAFSRIMQLTYDHLRAICEEINDGLSFEQALDILNISSYDMGRAKGKARLYLKNGEVYISNETSLDLSGDYERMAFRVEKNGKQNVLAAIYFHTTAIKWHDGIGILEPDDYELDRDYNYIKEDDISRLEIEIVGERAYYDGRFRLI